MTEQIVKAYRAARSRLLLLDYDGVLAPIVARPELAVPTELLLETLRALARDPLTQLVVISGRDRDTLEKWLGDLPIDLSAEHGHFIREDGVWQAEAALDMSWATDVQTAMQQLIARYPGSHIETKSASLVWHYRQATRPVDAAEIQQQLADVVASRATVMSGLSVIDVRANGTDKGAAAQHWSEKQAWDFVLCIGDDVTDEAMFAALPESAWTIKVGVGSTIARNILKTQEEVIDLLRGLGRESV